MQNESAPAGALTCVRSEGQTAHGHVGRLPRPRQRDAKRWRGGTAPSNT